jgi:hypothetical protein
MLAALLTFAAEAAGEESKPVAFYILGGAAACWAVILFAVGMRSPEFPGSAAAQKGVIAVSVLVVAGAMASAVLSS